MSVRMYLKTVAAAALCVWMAVPAVSGQTGTANAGVTGEGAGIPFERIVDAGITGVYVVLTAVSVLMVALIIYFLAVVRRGQIVPERLRRQLLDHVRAGNYDEARRLCRAGSSSLSAVVLTALDNLQSVPQGESLLLRDTVEAEGARQSEAIQGQIQYLTDVAVVAPMLGLLGTVLGMMIAFNAVHDQIAVVRPAELADGINVAMRTTAAGLIIGITATIFYAFFRRRAGGLIASLEAAVADIFTALIARRSVQ